MAHDAYSALDRPEILSFVFYPRAEFSRPPPNAADYFVPVDTGVSISCRLYRHSKTSPTILYFHGNGEVVSDYDGIAPFYNEQGINLLVADFRGYGASGGSPTFSSMASDAPVILNAATEILYDSGYASTLFVMGRSLGSIPAIEIAHYYEEKLDGLIIESGLASMANLVQHVGLFAADLGLADPGFPNLSKIGDITIPTLIMHGQYDSIIPSTEATALYERSAAADKRLLIIPGVGHNDIMFLGAEPYFKAIRSFVLP